MQQDSLCGWGLEFKGSDFLIVLVRKGCGCVWVWGQWGAGVEGGWVWSGINGLPEALVCACSLEHLMCKCLGTENFLTYET